MRHRPRWGMLGLGALIVAILFAFPYWRSLFTGRTGSARPFPLASDLEREQYAKMDRSIAATAYTAKLTVVPVPTNQQAGATPVGSAILAGRFGGLDAIRTGDGRATVYRLPDNSIRLRLTDFTVANAPQLAVYLCGAADPKDKADLDKGAPRFRVADLKGSVGDQEFTIPSELKLERYKSVVIYSEALQLIYSYANLR